MYTQTRGVKCFFWIPQKSKPLTFEAGESRNQFILKLELKWEMGEVWNFLSGNQPGQCFLLSADVDECLRPDVCGEGHCINTVGAFRCKYCDSGHRMSPGGHCQGEPAAGTGPAPPAECAVGLPVGRGPGSSRQLVRAPPALQGHSLFAALPWDRLDCFLPLPLQYLPSPAFK